MFFFDMQIKKSCAGYGLFAAEDVDKGAVVGIFPMNSRLMAEEDFKEEQQKGNSKVTSTGIRYVGRLFLFRDSDQNEAFPNHSFNPSLLYHCGILFAKRRINAGDEMTVDYSYLLASSDASAFPDCNTGRKVKAVSPAECMLKSASELISLIKSTNWDEVVTDEQIRYPAYSPTLHM
ncbi:SET domain-containing protein [Lentisphaerota bacterium ZTH]|nr:SET domain-containing protein [Lentisphaerota bacterium]WET06739.1 SET domain-containing protein [Lentisphaerota bacterium ZTH]